MIAKKQYLTKSVGIDIFILGAGRRCKGSPDFSLLNGVPKTLACLIKDGYKKKTEILVKWLGISTGPALDL
jgi:hypothetical protein